MEKTVRRFESHADADRHERELYGSMTPEQRLDVLLEIIAQHNEATIGEAQPRLARICRVYQRGER